MLAPAALLFLLGVSTVAAGTCGGSGIPFRFEVTSSSPSFTVRFRFFPLGLQSSAVPLHNVLEQMLVVGIFSTTLNLPWVLIGFSKQNNGDFSPVPREKTASSVTEITSGSGRGIPIPRLNRPIARLCSIPLPVTIP